MANLRVGVDSVRVMAGRWQMQATELGADAPPTPGSSSRASAAAVNAGHADIATANAALTNRVHTTATKVAEADSRYAANEVNSTDQLAAVAESATTD